jgi:hypothetical protein
MENHQKWNDSVEFNLYWTLLSYIYWIITGIILIIHSVVWVVTLILAVVLYFDLYFDYKIILYVYIK